MYFIQYTNFLISLDIFEGKLFNNMVVIQIFSTRTSRMIAVHQIAIPQICPKEVWVEQDPELIVQAVVTTMEVGVRMIKDLGFGVSSLVAVGITNQRETTVAWDSTTGKPLHTAIGEE